MSHNLPLHSKKDFKSLIKSYYFALIPLLLFSFYKNALFLISNDLVKPTSLIPLLYFYLISILNGFIISLIFHENSSLNILTSLLITSTISLNTNYLIFPILLFILTFITKYLTLKYPLKFNSNALIRLFLLLALLFNSYSYLNIGEKLSKFNFNYFDIFCGFNIGGIASTSTLLLTISLAILLSNKYYKKTISLTSILSYLTLILLFFLTTQNPTYLHLLLSGHIYFCFIFLTPDFYLTPYTKKGMLIYGLLNGIITSLLILVNIYEAPFISLLFTSLLIPIINKLTTKKYLNS